MIKRIIGFKNGNKIIDTDNSEKIRGYTFDNIVVFEEKPKSKKN